MRCAGGRWSCGACSMLPVECIVRGYITGSGWKDYQATGSVSGIPLPDGAAGVRAAAAADLHAEHEGGGGPRRGDRLRAGGGTGGRHRADGAGARSSRWRCTAFAAEHARARGVILADTKFEFGLDEDGELVLGDEVLTPDSSRYWPVEGFQVGKRPAELRQAVRARLGVAEWLGQEAAGAGDPRGRGRGHPRALRRSVRADHGRVVRSVAEARGRRGRGRARDERLRARVLIRPKQGILDPQGVAVERALPALGFAGVANVHVGRLVELDVEDAGAASADVREAAWRTRWSRTTRCSCSTAAPDAL